MAMMDGAVVAPMCVLHYILQVRTYAFLAKAKIRSMAIRSATRGTWALAKAG